MELANKNVLALITGAAGGFGQSIAQKLTSTAANGGAHSLTLILHGRSGSASRLTAVSATLQALPVAGTTSLNVATLPLDLETDEVASTATNLLREHAADVHHAMLFNNAGILRAGRVTDDGFAGALRESFTVNVVAAAVLARAFLAAMPLQATRRVIHTSTVVALHPYRAWAAYGASKAAADMVHATLAAECPDVRVLSYAPGAMRTGMTDSIIEDGATDAGIRRNVAALRSEGRFVDRDESAQKLMDLLLQDKFKNGQHIDFYDA